MSKKNQRMPDTVQVRTESVKRAAKIAKIIRIILYLGIAMMLFSRARAADTVFEVRKIKLGSEVLQVEIADDNLKRSLGLMNRKELKEGRGMLFIFDQEQSLGFWMKNTLIPLNIGYFDKRRTLFQTEEMIPASPMEVRPKSYPSIKEGQYALEVPKGWFARHHIKVGTTFTFVEGAKSQAP